MDVSATFATYQYAIEEPKEDIQSAMLSDGQNYDMAVEYLGYVNRRLHHVLLDAEAEMADYFFNLDGD